MRYGVYQKRSNGKYYQFLHLSRNHYTGIQSVIYVPLRVEKEWQGTIRVCDIPRGDFEMKFMYVGEGLPMPISEGAI